MKKLIALMLSLALLLGCACAVAETAEKTEIPTLSVNGTFKLKGLIPEGYKLGIINQDSIGLTAIMGSSDAAKPQVTISIAFNEEYADLDRFNNVSEEDYEAIKESFTEENDVTFEDRETAYGTKLLAVTESPENGIEFMDVYTIYKGYEIEFVMTPGSEELTEENMQMMIDFLSDLDFVEE